MKEIDVEELKQIQINILKYVDKFCKENDIKYWIDYGTLLGAVRHKGYIPWDDDIDISMLREDYEKFIKLSSKMDPKYKFFCYETDENCSLPYGKVLDTSTVLYEPNLKYGQKLAVFIDVFAVDSVPNDTKIVQKMYKKYQKYRKLNNLQVNKNFYVKEKEKYNFIRYPFHMIFQLLPRRFFTKKGIKLYKKYINYDTDYVAVLDKICKKSLLDSMIELEFEGEKFMAPKEYDLRLKLVYGDYMKLPPIEEQVTHHRFEAYYIEK